MKKEKIAIVGTGIMGEAIIGSLVRAGIDTKSILIRDKRSERVEELIDRYGVSSSDFVGVKTIVLSVKPQDLDACMQDVREKIVDGVLIVSLLAGVHTSRIEGLIGEKARVVRVMPNTPLTVGEGMSVIARGKSGTDHDANFVADLLSKSGKTLIVEEEMMDAVTAVSGSGPAYIYGFVEAMMSAASKLGLKSEEAELLVYQTLVGATKMLQESGKDASTLRREVTSPNGTTAAAIASFEASGLEEVIYKAMKAARDRSRELGN